MLDGSWDPVAPAADGQPRQQESWRRTGIAQGAAQPGTVGEPCRMEAPLMAPRWLGLMQARGQPPGRAQAGDSRAAWPPALWDAGARGGQMCWAPGSGWEPGVAYLQNISKI